MTANTEMEISSKLDHPNGLKLNIVLAGVGGQGTLVAGKLLGNVAMRMGLDAKVSEVHGMSQRGGSVITYVRIAEKVFSPLVEEGSADFILAFEELEGMRWSRLLTKGGKLLLNTQQIKPLPVLMKKASYPQEIASTLEDATDSESDVRSFDALSAALSVGSSKAVNMVMIGALSHFTNIPISLWEEAIADAFAGKEKLIPMNRKAFEAGRNLVATSGS